MDYFDFLVKMMVLIALGSFVYKFEKELLSAILWVGELFCRLAFGWHFGPNGFF